MITHAPYQLPTQLIAREQRPSKLILSILLFFSAGVTALIGFEATFLAANLAWVGYSFVLLATSYLAFAGYRLLKIFHADEPYVWLHPPLLMITWYIFGFGIEGLVGYAMPDSLKRFSYLVTTNQAHPIQGIAMIYLFFCFIWIAYFIALGAFKPFEKAKQLGKRHIGLLPTVTIFGLSILVRTILIRQTGVAYGADSEALGRFAAFAQWFSYIQSLDLLLLGVTAINVSKKRWPRSLLLAMITSQSFFIFISGFMKPLLFLMIILSVLLFYTNLISIKRNTILGILVLLAIPAFLIVPVAEGIRDRIDTIDSRNFGQLITITSNALEASWGNSFGTGMEITLSKLMGRQPVIAHTPSLLLSQVPDEHDFQGFNELLLAPFYIVPRALWSSKPQLSRGVEYGVTFFGNHYKSTSSSAITFYGEGYVHSGYAGVVFVAAVLGLLLGIIYRQTISAGLITILVAMVPTFIDIEGQFITVVPALIQSSLVYFVTYWVISKREYSETEYL